MVKKKNVMMVWFFVISGAICTNLVYLEIEIGHLGPNFQKSIKLLFPATFTRKQI